MDRLLVDFSLDSCIHVVRMFFEWRREDNSCIQCRILLRLNCKMAPDVSWVRGEKKEGEVGGLEVPIGEKER